MIYTEGQMLYPNDKEGQIYTDSIKIVRRREGAKVRTRIRSSFSERFSKSTVMYLCSCQSNIPPDNLSIEYITEEDLNKWFITAEELREKKLNDLL